MKNIAIIGGGAAGYFVAANLGKRLGAKTYLFEQSSSPLQKVRVSGGGRCNLTHACFDPEELVEFYPRGKKELRSVFHQFQPADTMNWFEERGVALKIESDNRVFPVTDTSLTIIESLLREVEKNDVKVHLSESVKSIRKSENHFIVKTSKETYEFDHVIFSPGSSTKMMDLIRNLDHKIIQPVPSLFTFNIQDERIKNLMGISFEWVEITIPQLKLSSEGPLLITHWGLSGPGILKLSAWGAILMHEAKYEFDININFIRKDYEECIAFLNEFKFQNAKKSVYKINPFGFPKRFWSRILEILTIESHATYSQLNKIHIQEISKELTKGMYKVQGKSTYKEEFVTAGGVDLKEVNFKTMESKIVDNLFFAGEILNIDAVTGGFNFQACWSEAYLISKHLRELE